MDWMEFAKTFGFAALCVIGLAWYIWKKDQQHREDIKQLTDEHKEDIKQLSAEHKQEVKELTKAVNRMGDLVQALIDEVKRK